MTYIDPQSKLFGHLDRLQQIQQAGRTSAPINVEIDLSNRCSLGCEWCHFAYTHTRGPLAGKRDKPLAATPGGDLMPLELAKCIVAELVAAGVRSITWTGGGEPTLHPDFDEIVEHTATFEVAQSVYTHGGHIDASRAALLKEHMTFVYVSLDAVDAETYKRVKGVDRFGAACIGIQELAAAPGDATIGIGYLVTSDNWQDCYAASHLPENLGADYVQFRPTVRYEQDDPGVSSEDTSWIWGAIDSLELLADTPGVEVDIDRFRLYRDWDGHGYPTCIWSMLQTCITPNGKVWACVSKREHAAAEIGDLSKETFREVWARHSMAQVNGDCRVMCRGHIPNVALTQINASHPHPEFV